MIALLAMAKARPRANSGRSRTALSTSGLMLNLGFCGSEAASAPATFQVGARLMVPDFFLPKLDVVIECWRSESRRGVALGWAERNALYVNLKFRRLKAVRPGVRCLGLAEFPQVDMESLRSMVEAVMEEFGSAVRELGGV